MIVYLYVLCFCCSYRVVCCFFFFSSRRRHTRSLRDWSSDVCSSDLDLERTLRERGKTMEIEAVTSWMPKSGQVSYTRQQEPLGLGHAVWCARDLEIGRASCRERV